MRKPLVAGNWKMNGTRASAVELAQGVASGAAELDAIEVLVCPTYVHIADVGSVIAGSSVALGAQDVYTADSGAYTGAISGAMLADMGCSYVIIGHSERRALMNESDGLIAKKFAAAQKYGLTPILCVGETLAEREEDSTLAVIGSQFNSVAEAVGIESFANAVVAYEPVWAIGTGKTASPEEAQEVHSALRSMAAKRSAKIAAGLRLLYGGSVKGSNADELFAMSDIDGGLIGGAALDADDFLAICAAAAKQAQ